MCVSIRFGGMSGLWKRICKNGSVHLLKRYMCPVLGTMISRACPLYPFRPAILRSEIRIRLSPII